MTINIRFNITLSSIFQYPTLMKKESSYYLMKQISDCEFSVHPSIHENFENLFSSQKCLNSKPTVVSQSH